jgi:hypothetical protein
MSSPLVRRAGVAIVRIEIDEATPERALIRVNTVDDVLGDEHPQQRAFLAPAEALDFLRAWLERCGAVTPP